MSETSYDEAKDAERRHGEARDVEVSVPSTVWEMATRRSGPHVRHWHSMQEIANHAYLQGLIDGAEAITGKRP